MGTIINDFFYQKDYFYDKNNFYQGDKQNDYQDEFDKVINDQFFRLGYDKERIRLNLLLKLEETFMEMTSLLISYVDNHKKYHSICDRLNAGTLGTEIDELDKVLLQLKDAYRSSDDEKLKKEYQTLTNIIIRDRNERADCLSDLDCSKENIKRALGINATRLIELYGVLNEVYDQLNSDNEIILSRDGQMTPIKTFFTKSFVNDETSEFLLNEYDVLLEEEEDYLDLIYSLVPLLSEENIDYNDLSNLEEILKRSNNVKEVLAIKKELLIKMYYKMAKVNSYDLNDNLAAASQEVCQMDSATDYVEHILNDGADEEISGEDLVCMNCETIKDSQTREINRRLTNVYLSHMSPIRVVK